MTESTTSSPHDAVFKTFMFTPETARDFLKYIYQSRCASFATCKPYAWNPPVLLKKFTRLLLGCFVVRGNQRG